MGWNEQNHVVQKMDAGGLNIFSYSQTTILYLVRNSLTAMGNKRLVVDFCKVIIISDRILSTTRI